MHILGIAPPPHSKILTVLDMKNGIIKHQPLTEMSTRNLPGGKGLPARKAHNLTAICEPIV
jgi:hypothetical protein